MEEESIIDIVKRRSRPAAMLGNHAVGEVLRLTAAIKHETTSRARDLLHRASSQGFPVLYTYMSDGWGCKVSTGRVVHVGQHIVRREGKVRAEFLLERSMYHVARWAGANCPQVGAASWARRREVRLAHFPGGGRA